MSRRASLVHAEDVRISDYVSPKRLAGAVNVGCDRRLLSRHGLSTATNQGSKYPDFDLVQILISMLCVAWLPGVAANVAVAGYAACQALNPLTN